MLSDDHLDNKEFFYKSLGMKFLEHSEEHAYGISISENVLTQLTFDKKNGSVTATFWGVLSEIEELMKRTTSLFLEYQKEPNVNWYYVSGGQMNSRKIALEKSKIFPSFYPFLGMAPEEFYDQYLQSKANVLILIGPPGTGKTTFIKQMLNHGGYGAHMTYDESLMKTDAFFVNFIDSDSRFLISEDSDTFLSSRSDGNTMMNKFLNLSDGLISAKDKKIIFTTNLPSLANVDEALVRKGRCFRVLEFRALTREEAILACQDIGVDVPNGQNFFLTDLFNQTENSSPTRNTFGFV